MPEFKEFPDSHISGRLIINPYWLEYQLNLFFQGYITDVEKEIWETQMDNKEIIENLVLELLYKKLIKNISY